MRFLSRLDFRTELPGSMERLSAADIRVVRAGSPNGLT